jgi:predicted DCC family thiol-disulfide oxidoreductase YuxK
VAVFERQLAGPRSASSRAPGTPDTADGGSVTRATILVYDEDCAFCKWSLDKILAWDCARRLRPVPIQSDEGERLLARVDPASRLASWHLVTSEGTLYSAGAAAAPLARILPGGRPLAALFDAFPRATERAYRYVARHRARWARMLRIDPDRKLRRT